MSPLSLTLLLASLAGATATAHGQGGQMALVFRPQESDDTKLVFYAQTRDLDIETVLTTSPNESNPTEVTRVTVGSNSNNVVLLDTVGEPALPVLRKAIMLPSKAAAEYVSVSVDVLGSTMVNLAAPVEPSKGHIKRNMDASTIPHAFSPKFYAPNSNYQSFFSASLIGKPFTLRDFTGQTLEVRPISYNAGSNSMQVATSMRITVTLAVPNTFSEVHTEQPLFAVPPQPVVRDFIPTYERVFANFHEDQHVALDAKLTPTLMVLYGDDFEEAASAVSSWKSENSDLNIVMRSCSDMGCDTDSILSGVESFYAQDPSFAYLLIVGDINAVPAPIGVHSRAVSDSTYALMGKDPEDYALDIFISRISAEDSEGAMFQINKFKAYDAETKAMHVTAPPAYDRYAIGIGSPYDGGTGECDFQRIQDLYGILHDGLGYAGLDLNCDTDAGPAGPEPVLTQAKAGRSVLLYTGHGSGTSWDTTKFSITNAKTLENSYTNEFIVDVSCDNGNFALDECLAESWLRGNPDVEGSGAISMFSSAPTADWIPPAVMQKAVVQTLVDDPEGTIGSAYVTGLMEAFAQYPNDTGYYLVESYVIFGDCSMPHGHVGVESSHMTVPQINDTPDCKEVHQ